MGFFRSIALVVCDNSKNIPMQWKRINDLIGIHTQQERHKQCCSVVSDVAIHRECVLMWVCVHLISLAWSDLSEIKWNLKSISLTLHQLSNSICCCLHHINSPTHTANSAEWPPLAELCVTLSHWSNERQRINATRLVTRERARNNKKWLSFWSNLALSLLLKYIDDDNGLSLCLSVSSRSSDARLAKQTTCQWYWRLHNQFHRTP